ncbi:MAG: hypothetical protein V4750_07220 [Pseudomonadota bacterium]
MTPLAAMPAPSLDSLRDWVGRSERRSDTFAAAPLAGLAATLDSVDDPEPQLGTPLRPLAHWLYVLPQAPQREIGADGHPKRGGFLLTFARDLRIGDAAERRSTIVKVEPKEARSGVLVFVTVRHEISDASGVACATPHCGRCAEPISTTNEKMETTR